MLIFFVLLTNTQSKNIEFFKSSTCNITMAKRFINSEIFFLLIVIKQLTSIKLSLIWFNCIQLLLVIKLLLIIRN